MATAPKQILTANPNSNARRKPAATGGPKPMPITLDQVVDQVFAGSGSAKRSRGEGRGRLGARIRGVLPGRGARGGSDTSDAASADPAAKTAGSVWGPAATAELRQFMGLPATLNWVPSLSLAPVFAASNPQATMCALRGAREEQGEGLRAAAAAWREADHVRAVGLRAWVLHDLMQTFPGEQKRLLEVAGATPSTLSRVLEQVPQKIINGAKNLGPRV